MPAERCTYKENGQRCRRNGTGNPAICHAHKLVLEQTAAAASGRPLFVDVLKDLLAGKRVSRARGVEAIFDFAGAVASDPGVRARMGNAIPDAVRQAAAQGGARPRPGPIPPPAPSPEDLRREAIYRCCGVLGLDATAVTAEMVTQRRRKLAREFHPDLVPEGPERAQRSERMKVINAAADELLEALG